MFEFLNTLKFEMFFFCLAVPTTIIFFIQIILLFFGMDHDADVDFDTDVDVDFDTDVDVGDGSIETDGDVNVDHDTDVTFKLVTVRSLIAFLMFFGWVGLAGIRSGWSHTVTILVAFAAGVLMMLVVALMMYLFSKLARSGTMQIQNAVGQVGTAYLPIPARKSGTGVIQVPVQGSLRELKAMTENEDRLPTGTKVKVTKVIDSQTVEVVKL